MKPMIAIRTRSHWLGMSLLATAAIALFVTPGRADRLPLPPALQEKVNNAVDYGVIFL
jgi:hypothetical protein